MRLLSLWVEGIKRMDRFLTNTDQDINPIATRVKVVESSAEVSNPAGTPMSNTRVMLRIPTTSMKSPESVKSILSQFIIHSQFHDAISWAQPRAAGTSNVIAGARIIASCWREF